MSKIFLGMPGYGNQTAAAGRSLWRACADMSNVVVQYQQGSLLAANFNTLWCTALNMVHHGEQVDYFAMLHDDIGLDDGWLDRMIEELEAKSLDVLGVAVPIKDSRGITSLALHREGDNWRTYCRLSMRDIYELPETFTTDDLAGRKLLLNTGCWVCKFDPAWVKKVHFEINDRIVFDKVTDSYVAQNESEDWFFSRLLHELNLKVGATRKIKAEHRGDTDFTNEYPWGTHQIDHCVEISPVPNAFPFDIPGWLHPSEGRQLAKLAEGKRVLEIGSYCGLSTVCMARTAKHVTAVDYFDGRGTPEVRDTNAEFQSAIERHGVAHKVETCHPDAQFPLPLYDLVFIDGDHKYESVTADIEKAISVLAPGGLIAFHDYRGQPGDCDGRWDAGVSQAVCEFIDGGAELLSTVQTLAVVRPPADILQEV